MTIDRIMDIQRRLSVHRAAVRITSISPLVATVEFESDATAEQRAAALEIYQGRDWTAETYGEKRAKAWADSPWNAAAQNSAMIKWFRGDASEITALSQFDLSVRAKWPKPEVTQ